MIICIIPTLLAAGLMFGFDRNGTPTNKAGLLGAAMLVGSFSVCFMLMLAWNAS
jgi:MFS transporter, ACS family, allantoate permease